MNWISSIAVYRDPRVLAFLFIGFSSGLPFGVLAEPLSAYLFDAGMSKSAIGLFALVSMPYAFKFVWSPFMDHLTLGPITRIFGRRRGWALLAQVMLLASIIALGLADPAMAPIATGVAGLMVAFASASQDIVVDAYRVEILPDEKLAAGAATATFGWRLGQVGAGAFGLILADVLPWPGVFFLMAAMVVIGIIAILLNPEPDDDGVKKADALEREISESLQLKGKITGKRAKVIAWLRVAFVSPFQDLLSRPGFVTIIAFILLYKFGDQVLAVMKVPFFLELGFSKTEIAEVVKIFGFNAIILGGFLGGLMMVRLSMLWGLMVAGILMGGSNMAFLALSVMGADIWVLAGVITLENVATGIGTTAFVAYLSSLCNHAFTATQYAVLTSLMALSRTLMSSIAGLAADHMSWPAFFVLSTIAALPGLIVLGWMIRKNAQKNGV